ncbi:MAG: hypothetical protein ACKOYN_00545 [Planctomycetota bacterium]
MATDSDPKTDRKRLGQVQTQDLTESRINEDFVHWLKTSGSNILLVVLLAACAVLGYNWWQRKNVEKTSAAWSDLSKATLPEAFEQLAKDHAEVPQAAMIALLQAGDLRLNQIRTGILTPAQGETPAVPLDEAGRKIALDAADENYAKAAEIATKVAGSRENGAMVVVPSLFGRAAIAESRGDFEGARKFLDDAAAVAGDRWTRLAEVAKVRAGQKNALASAMPLPKQADLPVKITDPAVTPAVTDDLFKAITEKQNEATGGTAPAPSEPAPAPTEPAPAPAPGNGG